MTWRRNLERNQTQREAILFWVTLDSRIINHHYCFALNDCILWHHTLTSRSFFHILRLQTLWIRTSSEWLIALKPDWHYSPISIGNHSQKAAEVIPVFFIFFYSLFNLSPLCSWREKKVRSLFLFHLLQPATPQESLALGVFCQAMGGCARAPVCLPFFPSPSRRNLPDSPAVLLPPRDSASDKMSPQLLFPPAPRPPMHLKV